MSYILDALKRADAERVRGQVPGLHAQPLGDAGSDDRGGGAPRWALWAGIAVGAVVLAALAWRMGADANAPVPAPLPPAMPAPEPLAQTAPAPAVTPATPVAPPAIPSYAPAPAAATRPPVKDSRPTPAPTPAAVTAQGPATNPATAVAPSPVAAATAQSPAAPPASARVPLLSELPASLRQQLPALAVSGSVYSDDAAARFIMLNGDVVKEGAQPAPGLFVERIEPKSAVLRFKGERFRLPY